MVFGLVEKHIYRFANLAMVNRTERWLSDQASNGWFLCDHDRFKYSFVQKQPAKREYMINPVFDSTRGVHYIFHMAKRTYGISQNKSRLNKISLDVFETDPQKRDQGFEKHIKVRNDYCQRHYFLLTLFFLVVNVVLAVLFYPDYRSGHLSWFMCAFQIISFIVLLYSTVSLGVISYDKVQIKKRLSD